MVLILTIEESEKQIISGFPESIVLSTNVPSTIFYTLDGTDPDEDSEIFINKIILPTNGLQLTLKAIAIAGLNSSAILEQNYYTSQSDLNRARLIGKEGINLLPPEKEVVDHLSFNQDGDFAQNTSIPEIDLDVIGSTVNKRGEDIPGDTTLSFVNFPIKQKFKQQTSVSELSNIDFDPKAFYIIMDGSTQEKLDQQTIRVINRPSGSMDLLSPIYQNNPNNYQLNSSNLVRTMYNPKTGIMTFYYRDSRENRWIKSTQQITGGTSLKISFNSNGPPNNFVFRWIEDRTQTRIY